VTIDDKVTPIGVEPPAPPPPSPPGKLHGAAITLMAVSALIGIVAMFMLATVQWTESTRSFVVGTIVFAGIGFVVFAGVAVLSAARDTYPRGPAGGEAPRG
jgi:hypothetical protein